MKLAVQVLHEMSLGARAGKKSACRQLHSHKKRSRSESGDRIGSIGNRGSEFFPRVTDTTEVEVQINHTIRDTRFSSIDKSTLVRVAEHPATDGVQRVKADDCDKPIT